MVLTFDIKKKNQHSVRQFRVDISTWDWNSLEFIFCLASSLELMRQILCLFLSTNKCSVSSGWKNQRRKKCARPTWFIIDNDFCCLIDKTWAPNFLSIENWFRSFELLVRNERNNVLFNWTNFFHEFCFDRCWRN